MATACLFLANKVEETFKKARDVITVTEKIKYRLILKREQRQQLRSQSEGSDSVSPAPSSSPEQPSPVHQQQDDSQIDATKLPTLDESSREHSDLKQRIFQMERILLQTIAFEFSVDHPYTQLLRNVKCVQGNNNLAQVRTPLWLIFQANEIAGATVYLAARFLKFPLPMKHGAAADGASPEQRPWWELFKTSPQNCRGKRGGRILVLANHAANTRAL